MKRGEILTGRKQLREATGISEQSLRTCLNRLKSTGEITSTSTSQYSIICICKYEDWQGESTSESTDQSTSDQPATNQPPTTDKNEKNDNNEKTSPLSIEARKAKFILDCSAVNSVRKIIPSIELIAPPGDLRQTFVSYWTAMKPRGKKMQFEKCEIFDIPRRLFTWSRNLNKFNKSDDSYDRFKQIDDQL